MDVEAFKHYSTLAVHTRSPIPLRRGLPRVRSEKFSTIWKIFPWCGALVTAVAAIVAADFAVVITSTSHSAPLSNLNVFPFSLSLKRAAGFARLLRRLLLIVVCIFGIRAAPFLRFLLMRSVTSRAGIRIFAFRLSVAARGRRRCSPSGGRTVGATESGRRKRKTSVPEETWKSTIHAKRLSHRPTIEPSAELHYSFSNFRKSMRADRERPHLCGHESRFCVAGAENLGEFIAAISWGCETKIIAPKAFQIFATFAIR